MTPRHQTDDQDYGEYSARRDCRACPRCGDCIVCYETCHCDDLVYQDASTYMIGDRVVSRAEYLARLEQVLADLE